MTIPKDKTKHEETTFFKIVQGAAAFGVVGLAIFILRKGYDFIVFVIHKGKVLANHIGHAVKFGSFAILGGVMLAIILSVIVFPIARRIRRRIAEREDIRSSCYPTLAVFRGTDRGSALNRLLSQLLAPVYRDMIGVWPDKRAFQGNPLEFLSFKRDQLPACIAKFPHIVDMLIREVQGACLSGNEKATRWVSPLVMACASRPKPLRLPGRLLHFLSFGRLGYASSEGYIKPNIELAISDWQIFSSAIRPQLFRNLKTLESMNIEFEFEFDCDLCLSPEDHEDISSPDEPCESPCESPSMDRQVLLLPAASIVRNEEEDYEDDSEAEETVEALERRQILTEEAQKAVATVLGFFERFQDPEWDSPDLLDKIESVLCQSIEHHPDPLFVRSKINWIQQLKEKSPFFKSEFEQAIEAKTEDDAPSWFKLAISKIGTEILDQNSFRRYCFLTFLLTASDNSFSPCDTIAERDPESHEDNPIQHSIGF